MDDKTYRRLVDEAFQSIDAAFEGVDPDAAESTLAQGTLTVVYRGGARLIVSPQPPVSQIWVAFRVNGLHLDYDQPGCCWRDDRGRDIDLYTLVETITRDACGELVKITPRA
jgi:iron donor protein CyaY